MRRLLVLACRAFPPEHHARTSGEVVDTALLAAENSSRRTVVEALSLVGAGLRERLHFESHGSAREGFTLLAWSLALVNLAVAVGGVALCVRPPYSLRPSAYPAWEPNTMWQRPFVLDWWWIAFAVVATGLVVGLARGYRWLAVSAALANLGVVGYDAAFLTDNSMNGGPGHLDVFTAHRWYLSFPAERQWFAVAGVLALATFAAPIRRLAFRRFAVVPVLVLLLVVLSKVVAGGFAFLAWPVLALVVLGIAFGAVAPRLAVLATGVTLAAVASTVTYVTTPWLPAPPVLPAVDRGSVATWIAAIGLTLGVLLPLVQLARRRLA